MRIRRNLLLAASLLALTSCQEDLQPEIDLLNTEVSDLKKEITRERERVRSQQEEFRELTRSMREIESEKRRLENETRGFERELAGFKKRETAAIAVEEAKPDAKELRAAASEAAKAHAKARVKIQGDQVSGAGLVVTADEKTWIYLSPATLSGNARIEITQVSGTPLKKFGHFEVIQNGTLARLEITEETDHAVTFGGETSLKSSAPLVSLDEAMNQVEGRASSLKPESMRTDSRIGAQPPGSLVFNGETGDPLAMLIPEKPEDSDLWPNNYRSSRRTPTTCLRLDQKGTWTAIPIGSFLEEARVLKEADRLTRLITSFAMLRPAVGGTSFEVSAGGSMSVKEVFDENKDQTAVRSMKDLNDWLREKSERASPQDVEKRITRVYDEIQRLAAAQTKQMTGRKFSPYHASAATNSMKWRSEAEKALSKTAASLNP